MERDICSPLAHHILEHSEAGCAFPTGIIIAPIQIEWLDAISRRQKKRQSTTCAWVPVTTQVQFGLRDCIWSSLTVPQERTGIICSLRIPEESGYERLNVDFDSTSPSAHSLSSRTPLLEGKSGQYVTRWKNLHRSLPASCCLCALQELQQKHQGDTEASCSCSLPLSFKSTQFHWSNDINVILI